MKLINFLTMARKDIKSSKSSTFEDGGSGATINPELKAKEKNEKKMIEINFPRPKKLYIMCICPTFGGKNYW